MPNDPICREPQTKHGRIRRALKAHGIKLWAVSLSNGLTLTIPATSAHDARTQGKQTGDRLTPAAVVQSVQIKAEKHNHS